MKGVPIAATAAPLSAPGQLPDWSREQRKLGLFSRGAQSFQAERTSLHVDPNGDEFVLEVSAAPDSVRECPPTITTRVVQVARDGREIFERILFRGTHLPTCERISRAPVVGGPAAKGNPFDVVLDALVFGAHGPIDVSVYFGNFRNQFEEYIRRADAYRSPRPPVAGSEMRMVDAAWVGYERRLVAAARDTGVTALAVAYVDSLRACYEWEGMHECPEREALFADAYQTRHPDGPFSDYLPLLSAHRWICAAEAYEYEKFPAAAERSRKAYAARLELARASKMLLIRTAAEYLALRNRCFAPNQR